MEAAANDTSKTKILGRRIPEGLIKSMKAAANDTSKTKILGRRIPERCINYEIWENMKHEMRNFETYMGIKKKKRLIHNYSKWNSCSGIRVKTKQLTTNQKHGYKHENNANLRN